MSQARIKPEIFVNFRPEPDPKSPARLTTLVAHIKKQRLSRKVGLLFFQPELEKLYIFAKLEKLKLKNSNLNSDSLK